MKEKSYERVSLCRPVIGALVAERRVRCVIFFWDPLTPQPHDVDVKALLRLTVLHNVPTACNRVTADFLISSPLFRQALSKTEVSDFLECREIASWSPSKTDVSATKAQSRRVFTSSFRLSGKF